MELRALRAAHRRLEWGSLLALPALYLALMAVGVFLFAVDYVLISLLFAVMLGFQRARQPARQRPGEPGGRAEARYPQAVIDKADAAFMRGARLSAAAAGAAYFVFLAGLDVELRLAAAGGRNATLIFASAAAGIALAALGREWALRRAWAGFAAEHPDVWSSQTDLDRGRTPRYPAAYLEWRASFAAAEGPR